MRVSTTVASFWPISKSIILAVSLLTAVTGCTPTDNKLPVLGQQSTRVHTVDGKVVTDTIAHQIAPFALVDQYGDTVTNRTMAGKLYVADFFFTSCPTICPKMNAQLKRVYDTFKDNPDVVLLSHSIDPTHDSVSVLRKFADNLGVTDKKWLFVTGNRDDIYRLGEESYMVTAQEDSSAPGGVMHSGALILVDKNRHIRGIYDGTTAEGTDKLMADMNQLLSEYKS